MQNETETFLCAAIELKSLMSSGAKKSMFLLYESDEIHQILAHCDY